MQLAVRFAWVLVWWAALYGVTHAAERIDLTARPWYVKQGFTLQDAHQGLPPVSRRVQQFPLSPNEIFNVPPGDATLHYALETSFPAPRVPQGETLGLFLSSIGENWAVYLNGSLVANDIHLKTDGTMARRRSVRDLLLPLPADLLRPGQNRLTFHVIGTAPPNTLVWNTALGFYRARGYYVGAYSELIREQRNPWDLAQIAIFLFFGYFALLVAFFRRQDVYTFYFGLLCLAVGLYYAMRSHFVLYTVADTVWVYRLEYAALMSAAPLMLLFLSRFFYPERRAGWNAKTYATGNLALATAVLAAPFRSLDSLLLVWQAMMFAGAGYIIYFVGKAAAQRRPEAAALIPALVLLCAGGFIDIADSVFLHAGTSFARYGFSVFVLTLSVLILVRTLRARNAAESLNQALLERDQRLRNLFQATFESVIIHCGGMIRDVNPSFILSFGMTAEEAQGRDVLDLFTPACREKAAAALQAGDGEIHRAEGQTQGMHRFPVEFANRPVSYRGEPAEALVIRDISERKKAEDNLQERNAELELLARAMADREQRLRDLEAEIQRLQKEDQ